MNNQNLAKLLVKLHDEDSNNPKWVHFCYVSEEVHTAYKEKGPEALADMNKTLSRWVKEDFNKDLMMDTAADVDILKSLIKEFCKNTYPDIYIEQSTDRQGWLRVWVTKKMKEDLKKNGK